MQIGKVRVQVPVGALLLAGVVLYALARWEGAVSSRDAEAIAGARTLLELSKPFHQQIARLAAERDRALAEAADAAAAAKPLDVAITRLASDTTIVGLRIRFPSLDSLLGMYERRDGLRLRELAAREMARQADWRALRLSIPRVTALEGSLGQVVEIADCHILGVSFLPRCPGRLVSFVLGAATTGTVVLLARKVGPR